MKATQKFLLEDVFSISDAESDLIELLKNSFAPLQINDVILKKSEAISSFFSKINLGTEYEVSNNVPITLDGGSARVLANLRIDKIIKISTESSDRFVNIELALNNREATGTNLLKLESISQIQSARGAESSLGILICLTNSLKDSAEMDKSYATGADYSDFMKKSWKIVIRSRILIIELHDV
jgi:hypothetical protein